MPITPSQIHFPCIYQVIEVKRDSITKKTQHSQRGRRVYLSSHTENGDPIDFLKKVRGHWTVENKNHHPRDATLMEDQCRCHRGNTAANLALLRGAVLCLWKRSSPSIPAPAFVARSQRKLDAMIHILTKRQKLRSFNF